MRTSFFRRLRVVLLAVFTSASLFCGVGAKAQVLLAIAPSGTLTLDGYSAQCAYAATHIISAGPTAGYAWYNTASGAIILNHDQYVMLPTFLKMFVFAHECGHRVYGLNEDTADCFAAKLGRDQGWFPPMSFPMITSFFAHAPGDWTHRPGPARVSNIAACYNHPGPP